MSLRTPTGKGLGAAICKCVHVRVSEVQGRRGLGCPSFYAVAFFMSQIEMVFVVSMGRNLPMK